MELLVIALVAVLVISTYLLYRLTDALQAKK
jgi:hypothetical protein